MKHLYRSSFAIIGISLITGVVVGPPTTAIRGEPQSFLPNVVISSTAARTRYASAGVLSFAPIRIVIGTKPQQ
jgi:hypothetical protein